MMANGNLYANLAPSGAQKFLQSIQKFGAERSAQAKQKQKAASDLQNLILKSVIESRIKSQIAKSQMDAFMNSPAFQQITGGAGKQPSFTISPATGATSFRFSPPTGAEQFTQGLRGAISGARTFGSLKEQFPEESEEIARQRFRFLKPDVPEFGPRGGIFGLFQKERKGGAFQPAEGATIEQLSPKIRKAVEQIKTTEELEDFIINLPDRIKSREFTQEEANAVFEFFGLL